jgi:hypothetical protein
MPISKKYREYATRAHGRYNHGDDLNSSFSLNIRAGHLTYLCPNCFPPTQPQLCHFLLIDNRVTLSIDKEQSPIGPSSCCLPNNTRDFRSNASERTARHLVNMSLSRLLEAERKNSHDRIHENRTHPWTPRSFLPATVQISCSNNTGVTVNEDDGSIVWLFRNAL